LVAISLLNTIGVFMLYDNDVVLVGKAVMLGHRDQDSCNAWDRIKKELAVLAQQSTNSVSLKLPTFKEVDAAVTAEISVYGVRTGRPLHRIAYDFISRQLQA
jgi:hypothetical protein